MGISAVVFGFLLQDRQVAAQTVPEFLASMRIIFGLCAGLCVVGVFCSLGRAAKR